MKTALRSSLLLAAVVLACAGAAYPPPSPGDYVIPSFQFQDGESMQNLRIHYVTLGAPHRDRKGLVDNAVLIMHGTGGSSAQFLRDEFAGQLFGKGQLLDASKYFLILPDDIGHGHSSKPSDGLRAKFPLYDYHDMVVAEAALITNGLHVDHLRLVLGTSMGCMHTWMWGEEYPRFVDAMMPLACLPAQISGRNRIWRRMIIDLIRGDPQWQSGNYTAEPYSLTAATDILMLMSGSPLTYQTDAPTADDADALLESRRAALLAGEDANDLLYAVQASHDYDPGPRLENIKANVLAVNTGDDQINPPELKIAEQAIQRVPNGKFVLIPIGPQTRGHGTHTLAAVWEKYLAELLDEGVKRY